MGKPFGPDETGMFEALKCRAKGHAYVDSRSQPGTEVCVRCRHRRSFEGVLSQPCMSNRSDPYTVTDPIPPRGQTRRL